MAPFKAGIFYITLGLLSASALGAKDVIYPDASLDASEAPQNPIKGLCYGKFTQGAVYETKTLKKLIKKAEVFTDPETGLSLEIRPATYSNTAQIIEVQKRRSGWFQTPCPPIYTDQFVRILQRSLAARGYMDRNVTGILDATTRAAILKLQSSNGLPSPILATSTAKALGLVATHTQN